MNIPFDINTIMAKLYEIWFIISHNSMLNTGDFLFGGNMYIEMVNLYNGTEQEIALGLQSIINSLRNTGLITNIIGAVVDTLNNIVGNIYIAMVNILGIQDLPIIFAIPLATTICFGIVILGIQIFKKIMT